ncbi:hypothetical protein CLOM_g214 [Closterium sp. NIES-68]|nr:hypothetical protein CLOM_g214 [Closterium sp. NIES-68]GJP68027.1 hypothetical protein CLOP_g24784 [Closterium sp. NIES-67]
MAKKLLAFLLLVAAFQLSLQDQKLRDGSQEFSYFWTKLQKTNRHWNFLAYLRLAGISSLSKLLSTTESGITILAPVDAGFAQLSDFNATRLRKDPAFLAKTLQLHILTPKATAAKLHQDVLGTEYQTLAGVTLEKRNSTVPGKVQLAAKGSSTFTTILTFSLSARSAANVHSVSHVMLPYQSTL